MVLNLEEDNVGAAILGDAEHIKEGDLVKRTEQIVQVPVGEALVGRVVNGIGIPIDGKGDIEPTHTVRLKLKHPELFHVNRSMSRCRPDSRRLMPWFRSVVASGS